MELLEENNNINLNSGDDDFTILFDKTKKNKTQVNEILPDWIINASKIDASFENSKKLSKLSTLSDKIKAILKPSIKKLFPVQAAVIPAILQSNEQNYIVRPHDICVCAPTGSGKTLAYVTPILQFLSKDDVNVNGPRAMIVLPVRDLATQVFNVINGLSKSIGIRCALINGNKSFNDEKKDLLDEIKDSNVDATNKSDVIVCTPGRLVDHLRNNKDMEWSHLRYLVIDEADRVLDDHKHDWYSMLSRTIDVERGVENLKKYKNIISCFAACDGYFLQKILLSATLTREPHLLEHFDLHYPRLYTVGGSTPAPASGTETTTVDLSDSYTAPKGLQDHFVVCSEDYRKIIFIVDQIRRLKRTKMLCFTNTRDSATRLSQLLHEFKGVRSEYLSCQLPPKMRRKMLLKFESGGVDVLVTVDSMARGMDIVGVESVVQYDLAADVHTHIHRVGRTARAGREGLGFALVTEKQVFYVKKSLSACHRHIKQLKFDKGKCYKYMTEYNEALAKLQSNGAPVTEDRDVRSDEALSMEH